MSHIFYKVKLLAEHKKAFNLLLTNKTIVTDYENDLGSVVN